MNCTDTSIVWISWSPTPRRLKLMRASFESLKANTRTPHTLVVVDNGPEYQTAWLKLQQMDVHIVNEVNVGIGEARNQGASATGSEYIAFLDSDMVLFPNWLDSAVEALEKYPNGKLIASPCFSSPMKWPQLRRADLDDYQTYVRASPQCIVLRRDSFDEIGPWPTHSMPGTVWNDWAREKGYLFLWHPTWTARHIGKRPSYNYRCSLVSGEWVSPELVKGE